MILRSQKGIDSINRRTFLSQNGAAVAALSAAVQLSAQGQQPPPIIDGHIHLFDQTRPQGAPYTGGKENTEPALPARYRALAAPLGIAGAIEIEASPWIEDNLWVLETIEKDTIMVGTCGSLEPQKPEFKEFIERYHKNKLFRGFRYRPASGPSFTAGLEIPAFMDGLKLTAQLGLVVECGAGRADGVTSLLKLKDQIPDLRLVVEHTGNIAPRPQTPGGRGAPLSAADRSALEVALRDLAKRPNVYFKLSQVLQYTPDGMPINNTALHNGMFDYLTGLFGEDRVMFGSDWPNGNAVKHLDAIVKISRDYFGTKSRAVQEKYCWRNSIPAYSWVKRDAAQPSL